MCTGPKRKVLMEGELHDDNKKTSLDLPQSSSLLLELSATDDLESFQHLVEKEDHSVDEVGLWYGRAIGSRKMGFQERTPLMIAAMFGSKNVLNYILQNGGLNLDVNRACGTDGATALHCAAAGGAAVSDEVVRALVDSSADVNQLDANGNTPADVIPASFDPCSKSRRKRVLEILLNKSPEEHDEDEPDQDEQQGQNQQQQKKEYPVDPSLPDIKNGIYGTDEFRMYAFKIKPCSRAYSHDWTECPFVHPGENARRRDPRKYHYSCVPCPEFRKGACSKGDACEYAHGIFECWLHPAQYRTRLCKDETSCNRRVCFFAHRPEELRPLYASTGSGVPSPRSYGSNGGGFDMAPPLSPLGGIGSPSMSMLVPPTSTPPLTPTGGSSPIGGGGSAWTSHVKLAPPALQLPSSRLKAALSARDMNLQAELQKQQLFGELGALSPSSWTSPRVGGALKPANLDDIFGSTLTMNPDPAHLAHQLNHQLQHQSQPVRSSFGMDPSSPVANPRLAAFANRSLSFIDRAGPGLPNGLGMAMPAHLSDWGSPDGKVDWGVQGDELNKLRKSASFGFRASGARVMGGPLTDNEPDVSWVQSLVKDTSAPTAAQSAQLGFSEEQLIKKQQQYHQVQLNGNGSKMIPPWVEQMYMEQEPMAA